MVAILFVRLHFSYYRNISDVEIYDISRDARTYNGPHPVVAHPPCRAWGRLRHMAVHQPGEKDLARRAVFLVRQFGGVLEHPAGSMLWHEEVLPLPGQQDAFGGWTLPVSQKWWGHEAEKPTWLYIVGCTPKNIPPIPFSIAPAIGICGTPGRRRDGSRLRPGDTGYRPEIAKSKRELTPPRFAAWLVELAHRSRVSPCAGYPIAG